MKILVTSILFIVSLIMQSTVMNFVQVHNVKPNIIIIIIICMALIRGTFEGTILGFCGGFLLDLFLGKSIGLSAFLCMYIGMMAGGINRRLFRENYFVSIIFVFIFSFIYEFGFFFLKYYVWGEERILTTILMIIIPICIYNSCIAIPIYRFIMKLNEMFFEEVRMLRKY